MSYSKDCFTLAITQDVGGPNDPPSRTANPLSDILSATGDVEAAQIVLSSVTNKDYSPYDPSASDMILEAVRPDGSLAAFYRFKLHVYTDCTNSALDSILLSSEIDFGTISYNIG